MAQAQKQLPWGMGHHIERDGRSGRYAKSPKCDCCGKPTGREYATDDEVCNGGDGPGFYLCSRTRCIAKYEGLDVETRRKLFTESRALHGGP